MAKKKKSECGKREWPEPIPETPENLARILMGVPPVRPEDETEPPMVLSGLRGDGQEER